MRTVLPDWLVSHQSGWIWRGSKEHIKLINCLILELKLNFSPHPKGHQNVDTYSLLLPHSLASFAISNGMNSPVILALLAVHTSAILNDQWRVGNRKWAVICPQPIKKAETF